MIHYLKKPGKSSLAGKARLKVKEIEASETEDCVSKIYGALYSSHFVYKFLDIAIITVAVK